MYKHSGIFMVATGIIHMVAVVATLILRWPVLTSGGIFNVGLGNTAAGFVWFAVVGLLIIMGGLAMHAYIKQTGRPVPRSVGVVLAVITAFLLVTEPVSGVWLFVPQVFILLLAPGYKKAQQSAPHADQSTR
jgi:hypothetical protein